MSCLLLAGLVACSSDDPKAPETVTPVGHAVPSTEPVAVWATWQRDPTTTLTIHWMTRRDTEDDPRATALQIRRADDKQWITLPGFLQPLAGQAFRDSFFEAAYAEATGLEPGTDYVVRVLTEGVPSQATRTVRTLRSDYAAGAEPLRIAHTGCILQDFALFRRGCDLIGSYDVDFAVFAGDIAYANAELDLWWRWVAFLETWDKRARTTDGRIIPVVASIGNHEVVGSYDKSKSDVPFFHDLFSFPSSGYGVLDIGDEISLVVLDSDHTNDTRGPQRDWMKQILPERTARDHLIAIYHVPAYPGHRRFNNKHSRDVRTSWLGLFERHGVDLCLEAHDHCYKRTLPIRNGAVRADGIVYIGDGGMATRIRPANQPGNFGRLTNLFRSSDKGEKYHWYLANSASDNVFTLIELQGLARNYHTINLDGEEIDRYAQVAWQPSTIDPIPRHQWYRNPDHYALLIGGLVVLLAPVLGLRLKRARAKTKAR